MIYDYIIVGAGSAGSVLAYRISENPRNHVLLIEAGPPDRHPFIRMPKGFARTVFDPALCWYFPLETEAGCVKPEVWVRGRTLGGSSSINGELYVRGLPSDYDHWEALGARGWAWSDLLPCFRAVEDHALGAAEYRGVGGPLHVSVPADRKQPAVRAFIEAAVQMGLPYKEDLNAPGDEGVGYFPQTIRAGRRVSAADAFLAPALRRRNLEVLTGVFAQRIEFEGLRATGVICAGADGVQRTFRGREIILSAGAINSPKLLQLSGIGPPDVLRAAGVEVRHPSPGVGANLREHRYMRFQFRLTSAASCNWQLSGVGLVASVIRYYLMRSGPLATGAFDAGAMLKTRPDLDRPDVQINMAPISIDLGGTGFRPERLPGIQVIAYPMRPESQGTISIVSADPAVPPRIRTNYLTAEYDRETSIRMVAAVRKLIAQPPVRALIKEETIPGPSVSTPEEIIAMLARGGGRGQGAGPGQHAACTCAMGTNDMAVVDPSLRVIGVEGLRVMDASVMPTMVSGNTNAPVMAMAWRAADIILGQKGLR